jgi:hypothetical protein
MPYDPLLRLPRRGARTTNTGSVTSLTAGVGITLTPNPITTTGSIALSNTAVTPGTYGDGSHVGQFTVNQQGQLTFAQNVAITFPSTAGPLLDAVHNTDTVAHTPVLGDLIYANSTPKWQALAGQITTTRMFLRQTGTGSVSAAPAWDTLVAGDIPALAYVTSVALSAPAEFTVSGSPVTSSGTLTLTKANENANTVWAGPTSGAPAQPTFRTLVIGDIPDLSSIYATAANAFDNSLRYGFSTYQTPGSTVITQTRLAGTKTTAGTASESFDTDRFYVNYATSTALNTNGGVDISSVGPDARFQHLFDGTWWFKTGSLATDVQNVRIWTGYFSATLGSPNADTLSAGFTAVAFRFSTAVDGTTWHTFTRNGTSNTFTAKDSTVAVNANTAYVLRIKAVSTSEIDFYINGVLVTSHTSGGGDVLPGVAVNIDWASTWVNLSAGTARNEKLHRFWQSLY